MKSIGADVISREDPTAAFASPKPCKPVDPQNNLLTTGFTFEPALAIAEKTP